jgi:hypothetical protein
VKPAEKAEILARLNAVEQLLLQIPELARPEGFEILPSVGGGRPSELGDGTLAGYSYNLTFFNPTKKIAGEGNTALSVIINPNPGALFLWGQPGSMLDQKGQRLYIEHPWGEKKPGALLAYGTVEGEPEQFALSPTARSWYTVFFSADGSSPWLEVSRQEYIEAMIWDLEVKDAKGQAEIQRSLTTTPYQRWLEEAPQRKTKREEMLAAVGPGQAAELRKTLEQTEREVTENLRASEAQDRAENARLLAQDKPGDQLRANLAAMTPAERAMPAWTGASGGAFDFFPPKGSGAVRIVRPNLAFYRPRHSPIEPRGVVVRFTASLTGHTPPVQRALYQAYRNLDWAALRGLLAPGRPPD